MHGCKSRIIPYVLTWDGIVIKFNKTYAKEIGLPLEVQAYIQFIVLKKTLESHQSWGAMEYQKRWMWGTVRVALE